MPSADPKGLSMPVNPTCRVPAASTLGITCSATACRSTEQPDFRPIFTASVSVRDDGSIAAVMALQQRMPDLAIERTRSARPSRSGSRWTTS